MNLERMQALVEMTRRFERIPPQVKAESFLTNRKEPVVPGTLRYGISILRSLPRHRRGR